MFTLKKKNFISITTLYFKTLEKEQQTTLKATKRKEINIRCT